MSKTVFRAWSPDQCEFFPPAFRDLVPSGHLVHFVRKVATEDLNLSTIYARYDNAKGQPPYAAGAIRVEPVPASADAGITVSKAILAWRSSLAGFRPPAPSNLVPSGHALPFVRDGEMADPNLSAVCAEWDAHRAAIGQAPRTRTALTAPAGTGSARHCSLRSVRLGPAHVATGAEPDR